MDLVLLFYNLAACPDWKVHSYCIYNTWFNILIRLHNIDRVLLFLVLWNIGEEQIAAPS